MKLTPESPSTRPPNRSRAVGDPRYVALPLQTHQVRAHLADQWGRSLSGGALGNWVP
jgi:hypothetical protein